MKKLITIFAIVTVMMWAVVAQATWNPFVIRNANGTGNPPTITENPSGYPGWTSFGINEGGQKAGWGNNIMNGQTVGIIQSLSIIRHSSVVGWGPYFNIWITDGLGGYAVLANEPSHTWEYTNYGETAYDMTWEGALKNATTWIYEVSSTQGFLLPNGITTYSSLGAGTPNPFHFEDFANYLIATPSSHWGGTGAPDDLNASTYTAYGFNWVFGDTQNNYTGSYLVKNPNLTPIPEPSTIALLGFGLIGLGVIRNLRQKRQ